ncbi:MAG: ligand-binding sensor domain-containing protein [Bacteroidota bacterium]
MRRAILILLMYAQGAAAQSGFRTISLFTTQSGLSNNSIYCMAQDSRGFIWMGTRDGLNRFDGYRFKNFFAEKDPAAGLAANYVFDIVEYKAGQLLIATSNGLSVLNTWTGSFENDKISHAPLCAGSGILMASLFKDQSGNIWINHSGELDVLDSNLHFLERLTDLPWAQSLKGIALRAHAIKQQKQPRLWLPGDTTGIHIIDWKAKKVYDHKNNPFHYPFLTRNYIRCLLLDEINNCLWYGPWGRGLEKYDFATCTSKNILFSNATQGEEQSVNLIRSTGSGTIFCLTSYQFFQVPAHTGSYSPVTLYGSKSHQPATKFSFHTLFHSSDNQYWLGTSHGLWQLKNEESFLRKLTINLEPAANTEVINTGVTISPAGKLYLGYTPGSLAEIEQNRKDYHLYNLSTVTRAGISRVYADNEGLIWVGTTKGLYLFDPAAKKFTGIGSLPDELKTGYIASVYKTRDGTLWVSTRYRFSVWRRKRSGVFEQVEPGLLKKFSSLGINSRVSEYAEENERYTWIISRLGGGLMRYDKKNNEWQYFPAKKENKAVLAEIGLNYVAAGNNENLWLTDVLGNGLIEYYYRKDSIVRYTRNDGLPSSIIKAVCSDEKNNLWIATDYGLTLFDKNKRRVVSTTYYTWGDESEYEQLVYDKFSGSIVYVLNNELFFFNEAATLSPAAVQPVPLLENLFVNNTKTAVTNEKLRLRPFQKNITIDFTAVQFLNADKIKFAYRLSGADYDWKQADAGRTAHYSRLSPGHYRFYLKATDVNGNWGPESLLLSFTIAPPFWKTWWFLSGLGILIIALVYALYRYRIRQLIKLQKVRNRIATDLHDDIGTSLTNISLLSELTSKNMQQPAQAQTFIQRINEEVNRSGQALDDIVWSINTRNDSVEQVVARMRRYAAEIFEGAGINYSLYMDEQLSGRKLNMEQRRDLFLIFKELVNNIYKHAGANNVSMKLKMENNKLHFSVHDDGKGFDAELVSSRNGIKNIQQRIARWKGTIHIDTIPGGGTQVLFIVPVERHHSNE